MPPSHATANALLEAGRQLQGFSGLLTGILQGKEDQRRRRELEKYRQARIDLEEARQKLAETRFQAERDAEAARLTREREDRGIVGPRFVPVPEPDIERPELPTGPLGRILTPGGGEARASGIGLARGAEPGQTIRGRLMEMLGPAQLERMPEHVLQPEHYDPSRDVELQRAAARERALREVRAEFDTPDEEGDEPQLTPFQRHRVAQDELERLEQDASAAARVWLEAGIEPENVIRFVRAQWPDLAAHATRIVQDTQDAIERRELARVRAGVGGEEGEGSGRSVVDRLLGGTAGDEDEAGEAVEVGDLARVGRRRGSFSLADLFAPRAAGAAPAPADTAGAGALSSVLTGQPAGQPAARGLPPRGRGSRAAREALARIGAAAAGQGQGGGPAIDPAEAEEIRQELQAAGLAGTAARDALSQAGYTEAEIDAILGED